MIDKTKLLCTLNLLTICVPIFLGVLFCRLRRQNVRPRNISQIGHLRQIQMSSNFSRICICPYALRCIGANAAELFRVIVSNESVGPGFNDAIDDRNKADIDNRGTVFPFPLQPACQLVESGKVLSVESDGLRFRHYVNPSKRWR